MYLEVFFFVPTFCFGGGQSPMIFSEVYGAVLDANKIELWEELMDVRDRWDKPWCGGRVGRLQ